MYSPSSPITTLAPLKIPFSWIPSKHNYLQFHPSSPNQHQPSIPRPTKIYLTLRNPRGFGPPPPKKAKKKIKNLKRCNEKEDDDDDDEDEDYEDDDGEGGAEQSGVIPEVVTNRMITRMGFSVGIPLSLGLLFFPLFYYLKVVQKVDVPNWVPFGVSFIFFGTALLGVSYGIMSSSWDPSREGSILGWKEAQKNWPVFWQSLWGGYRKN